MFDRNVLLSALVSSALTASLVVAGSAAALEVGSRLGITAATSTTTIPLQVRLASSGGTPTNGLRTMTFKLYNTLSGGSALWSETWTAGNAVQVTDGVASVLLGSQTALPQSIVANNSTLYLGITVDVEAEMQPRMQVGSVPYAFNALTVPDGSITSDKLATPLPRLLGQKSFEGNAFSETVAANVPIFKGANALDPITVVVTTTGRTLLVIGTGRYLSANNVNRFCFVSAHTLEDALVWSQQLDGTESSTVASTSWSCSGSQVLTALPAGTYKFSLRGYIDSATSIQWQDLRQIAIFEF